MNLMTGFASGSCVQSIARAFLAIDQILGRRDQGLGLGLPGRRVSMRLMSRGHAFQHLK